MGNPQVAYKFVGRDSINRLQLPPTSYLVISAAAAAAAGGGEREVQITGSLRV